MLTSVVDGQGAATLPQDGRGYAIAAGILGWTLDAFDFFVVVFMVDILASHFQVAKSAIILSIGATLAMRPVGAGRSLWATQTSHGCRCLFFAHRSYKWPCCELPDVPGVAVALWNWHGRILGSWSIFNVGKRAESLAWASLGAAAGRISPRLFVISGSRAVNSADVGMARNVLGGFNPGRRHPVRCIQVS